jgi:hypothetical protein
MTLSASFAAALDNADPHVTLRDWGYARLDNGQVRGSCGLSDAALAQLTPHWRDLPPDPHLRDSGAYRSRRHACYMLELTEDVLTRTPHRAHWQPLTYNALHGGIERWFAPIDAALDATLAWPALLRGMGQLFAEASRVDPEVWYIEAHQFRIDTANGIGRPTPEGAHRDGVDYVAIILVERQGVRGGETRVFPADGQEGVRFTLAEPWSALLLDDARVLHETSPILPALDEARGSPSADAPAAPGYRDTLVLTYRRDGFQDPPPAATPA